jgi:hypothetical protein
MKLIIIVLVFVGGLSFSAWKTVSYFNEKKQIGLEAQRREKNRKETQQAIAKALEEERAKHPLPAPGAAPGGHVVPVVAAPVEAKAQPVQVVVGSYRFQNRIVPAAPAFLKEDNQGMIVQTEETSNSWVWMGSAVLASQIVDLAKTYDVRQMEMDLDFCLVLVNCEKLRGHGISFMYEERASWLDALELTGDVGSLRISAGGFSADVQMGDSSTGLSVLSQPVIRCLEGRSWKFATESEIPVPSSEVMDGTIRQSIEFRKVGFGLEGTVRTVGNSILLTVEQRNGSVAPAASGDAAKDVPVFNVQSLQTSCELGLSEWSVLGGIQVDKEELRKGLFRDSFKQSSEYLVIFVRPRAALEAPPAAVPVTSTGNALLPASGPGVLPPKGWIDDEIELVEERIRRLHGRGVPAAK